MRGLFCCVLIAAAAGAAGNLLISVLPWSREMIAGYEAAAGREDGAAWLLTVLAAGPALEELIFRQGVYRWVRRRAGFWPGALLSAMAFGVYHGNLIQGSYAFLMGILLAWGYEWGPAGNYRTALLMHIAANGAALLLYG